MLRALNRARHDRIDAALSRVNCPILVIRGATTTSLDRTGPSPSRGSPTLPRRGIGEAQRHAERRRTHGSYTHADAVARHVSDFLDSLRCGPDSGDRREVTENDGRPTSKIVRDRWCAARRSGYSSSIAGAGAAWLPIHHEGLVRAVSAFDP